MPSTCTICLDDHAEICFECVSPHCEYALCDPCLVDALKDCSGSNSEKCPMCKHPSAIRMATACIGVGGVMAVERGLRDRVEHDIRKQLEHKAFDRKEASMTNQKAVDIFNQITEELNLKCPRCETVFYDYEGCNALKCSQGKCGAAFCAICLQDCGRDAHTHVRKNHGDLFDKGMFKRNAAARANQVIKDSLHALEEEGSPFELTQAVKNHLDKAGYLGSNRDTNTAPFRAIKFIGQATKELESVIESDRLSVLVDSRGAEWRRSGITFDSVSPRACIPQDTRVWLLADNDEYELQVQCFIEDRWASTTSPEQVKEWIKDGVIPPSGLLSNLSQSLRASIVAFEGSKKLYQIIRQPGSVGSEKTKLKFYEVVSKGKIEQDSTPAPIGFAGRQRVLALNPNHRYLELLKHIENNVSHESLPNPICHFIGCGASEPVLTELETMLPSSFESLNQDQRSAGHPLLLRSAGEVAGPPGTGKYAISDSYMYHF